MLSRESRWDAGIGEEESWEDMCGRETALATTLDIIAGRPNVMDNILVQIMSFRIS